MPDNILTLMRMNPSVTGTLVFCGFVLPFIVYICHVEFQESSEPPSWSNFLTTVTDLDCCMETSMVSSHEKRAKLSGILQQESIYVPIPSNEKLLTEFIDKNLEFQTNGILVAQGEIFLEEIIPNTNYGDQLITLKFEIPKKDEHTSCLHIIGPKVFYKEMIGLKPATNCSTLNGNNYTLLDMKLRSSIMESHNEWCKNAKEEITFSINCFNDAYFSTDEEKVQFDTISMVLASLGITIVVFTIIYAFVKSKICNKCCNRSNDNSNPEPIVMVTMENI